MALRQGVRLKDHTILALDIGTRFIKAAELRLSKGIISLLNVAVRPTPANVLNSNQILDPVGLGRAVREMLAVNKIKTKNVIVSVSGQSSVVVRPIELPKMSRKELNDTMKFEVERHIPFTADEVVMDYAPLIEPDELPEDESNMKVLLAVAQEELIKSYLKVIQAAGLKPVAMDVEILSVVRALLDIHNDTFGYTETVALVNIGAVSTDISIVDKGLVIFTRSVPIAGDTLTEAIADQLGRDIADAEELKKELGTIFLEPEPGAEEPANSGDNGMFNLGALPTTGQSDSMYGDNLGSMDSMFPSGDTENAGGVPFTFGDQLHIGSDAPEGSSAPNSPIFGAVDADSPIPFTFDDDVDDEVPILRLGDDDDSEANSIPTFRFDDDVDDDVPIPAPLNLDQPEPVTIQPENDANTPEAVMGPVFDLSSELENQLPQPLTRPSHDSADETESALPEVAAPYVSNTPPPVDVVPFQLTTPELAQPPLVDPFAQTEQEEQLDAFSVAPQFTPTPSAAIPETSSQDTEFQRQIFDAMLPTLLELVAEVRRSLEYYTSREPDTPVERVIIYGGTSRLPNLAEFFHHEIGLEVVNADPTSGLNLSSLRQPQDYLHELAPALPVCIGLALRDMIE